MGEEVSVPGLTLVDDPTDPDAYGASRYDAEGLATRRNVLIEGGVLRKFLYNTYAARRAGTRLDRVGGAGRIQERARVPGPGP